MKSAVFSFIFLLTVVNGASLRWNKDSSVEQEQLDGDEHRRLDRMNGDVIPGSYIITMKNNMEPDGLAVELEQKFGKPKRLVLRHALKGIIFDSLTDDEAAEIATKPDVLFVEQDRVVSLDVVERQTTVHIDETDTDVHSDVPDVTSPLQGGSPDLDPASQVEIYDGDVSTQDLPWGINRVQGGETYRGGNVAWILDSGIDLNHPDLNVQVQGCFSAFSTLLDMTCNDMNGHGTHVAGIIAAKNNNIGVVGVAAGAKVVPVKVLDKNGDGTASGVLAGLEWVATNGKPGDVANLSLGGQPSLSLDTAVMAVARQGIKITLAAGNSASLAEDMSPGRVNADNVYTISAIDMNDRRASFSNFGSPPIDYAAPGVDIRSTWNRSRYATLSGTSMAAPHVAGLLLLDNYKVDGRMKELTNADFILVNQRSGFASSSTVSDTTAAEAAEVVVEGMEEDKHEETRRL